MMTPLIQADTNTINQSMMTRTPLFQDDALSFNQAKISNPPYPCSFRILESSMLCPDLNALPFVATTCAELCKLLGALLCSFTQSRGY